MALALDCLANAVHLDISIKIIKTMLDPNKIILPLTHEENEILKRLMNPQSLEDYGLSVTMTVVDKDDIIDDK